MRDPSPWRLVWWPAVVTMGVTILRLAGELLDWSPTFFSRSVGGGGAVIGVIWLVPVFAAYFGYRMASTAGEHPALARVVAWDVAALATLAAFLAVGFSRPVASVSQFLAIGLGSWIAIALASRGWPRMVGALIRYGLLARIPVALVILLGILGNWRTHYDTPPPGLPELGVVARWTAIGIIPQLTLWMAVTVVLGLLFAVPAAALTRRSNKAAAEA